MNRRLRWRIVISLVVIVGVSVFVLYPLVADRLGLTGPSFLLRNRLALGLDLKGGVQFVLRVNVDEAIANATPDQRNDIVTAARETIVRRVDDLGVVEPLVAVQGAHRDEIVVQLPGYTDVARARTILGTTARLEWKVIEAGPAVTRDALAPNGIVPADAEILPSAESSGSGSGAAESYYLVQRAVGLAGSDVRGARAARDSDGQPMVAFSLTPDGSRKFTALTAANVGRRLAIVLDSRVRSAPLIDHPITGDGASIVGRFSPAEAADLALVLRSGALPASMTYLGGQYVGPTLGAESVWAGIGASAAGLAIVAAFMLLYYNRAGINAVVSLVVNLLLLVGAMIGLGAAMTLPGIAGVILTIGMGVDSNVLIFERIKEELKVGRPVRAAVAAGFDRVFLTILDTHVTSLIAAAFLFQFGTGPIRGFATTLTIGLLANVFTAVFVSRTLFDVVLSRRGAPALKFSTMPRSAAAPAFDVFSRRKITLAFSAAVIAASLALLFIRGIPLGPDFSGGTTVVAHFAAPVSDNDVRAALPSDAMVQRYGAPTSQEVLIRLAQPPQDAAAIDPDAGVSEVKTALDAAHLPRFDVTGSETIGPAIGKDLQKKGEYATIASLAGMGLYVARRFRPSFATGALIATIHDVLITVAVLSLCGYDLTLNVVAAVLTVAGYSVNDTIVVFDRVRETLRAPGRPSIAEAINAAVNQTLGRTLITSATTSLAVVALLLFGGHVLHGFALAMLVGIVTGTYSTVFVAAPIAARLARPGRMRRVAASNAQTD